MTLLSVQIKKYGGEVLAVTNFFFTESTVPVKELVEKYGMPKSSIYRKRDDALKTLKKILENA